MQRKAPPLYRFVADRSGQSNPLAVIVLLGITVTSSGLILGVGTQAFDRTRETASLSLNEQSMSKLDAEAAVVALGSADTRQIRLGDDGDGQYSVRDSGSWIRIEHQNHTGTGTDETVYNASLGGVVYESSGESIAYEGGGVWRTDEPGNTVMVSPPEFRYRGATLTLPVIRVTGDTDVAGGGRPTASVESATTDRRVFPSGSTYSNADPYANPVTNGSVAITVHSPHYAGWADYFRERTTGNVSVDSAARRATVVLEGSSGELGLFQTPGVGDSVEVPAVAEGHSIDEFNLRLEGENSGPGYNNRIWGFTYEGPDQRYAVQIDTKAGNGASDTCQGSGNTHTADVRLTIYYDNKTTGKYQAFEGRYSGDTSSGPIKIYCDGTSAPSAPDITPPTDGTLSTTSVDTSVTMFAMPNNGNGNGNGNSPGPVIIVNLTSATEITYQEPSPSGGYSDDPFQSSKGSSADVRDGVLTDEHGSVDTVGGDDTLNKGDSRSIDWVTNHYLGKLAPRFSLTVKEGPGSTGGGNVGVNEQASQGELRYDLAAGSDFIRYLHVTENEIRVRIT